MALLSLPLSARAAEPDNYAYFMSISRTLTGKDRLDENTAERIYDLIRTEPWGPQHVVQVAEKLKISTPDILALERESLLNPDRYSAGERWFINHLLTTWLTGIYYHQNGNKVVSYRHALMFTSLDGVSQPRSLCGGSFGFWSEAPDHDRY